jgi:LysR family transcriptional regulator, glycine cleavage system transcriptional activator
MNPRRLTPSMSLLLAFEAAAKHESFTRAAEELCISQSAVSRQVQGLEQLLEVELFRREGRKIVLTDAGAVYQRELAGALGRIRNATLQVASFKRSVSSIRISVLPTLGTKWIMPRLAEFQAVHPEILINVSSRIGEFDLDLAGVDAAISSSSDGCWPGCDSYLLFPEELVLVASPALSISEGAASLFDLFAFPILNVASRPSAWREWIHTYNRETSGLLPDAQRGQTFELTSHLIQAVIAGMGIALVPKFLIIDELASGALRQAHPRAIFSGMDYYLFVPKNRIGFQSLTIFRRWLMEIVGNETKF